MWKNTLNGVSFQNVKYIFPLKQKAIYEMIKICKNEPNVEKLIIFGSSVTSACNPWSDIDAYFEIKEPMNNLPLEKKYTNQDWDRWSNFSVDESLKKEILKTGVVVYDRNNC